MFLEYDQLVKHNSEVNWNIKTIWFIKCPKNCRIIHQDISFRNRRIQLIDNQNQEQQEIDKELDLTNLKDLLKYI